MAQPASPSLVLPAGEEILWRRVADDYDAVYTDPTEVVPIDRIILPWEKSRAVALALPLGEFNYNPKLAALFQDILAALLPRVEVIAIHHRLDRRVLGDFLIDLEMDERISPYLDRLIIEPSEAYSIWMRDFGPQFAVGVDGSLVLLDPSIGDPEASRGLLFDVKAIEDPIQQHFKMVEELGNLRGLEGSDRIPSMMSGVLESRWRISTSLSRPPLFLQGGDFLPVDKKSALVSASTLRVNGGVTQDFRKSFLNYYGLDKVVLLENLPGKTIEHLDFVVQPIRENMVLMADPPVGIGSSRAYHRKLNRDLKARFARNESAVRKAFPQATIVNVPMPPPALDSDVKVLRELFLSALQVFVTKERIAMRFDPATVLSSWESFDINPRIEAKLFEVAGISSWRNEAGQSKVIEKYLGSSYTDLLARHVEEQVNYRSYVNSLYVNCSDGSEIVLLPKFSPLNESEKVLFPKLEEQVSAAYAIACPGAEQIWIDCTVLTDFMGMIHCFTLTIPDLSLLEKSL